YAKCVLLLNPSKKDVFYERLRECSCEFLPDLLFVDNEETVVLDKELSSPFLKTSRKRKSRQEEDKRSCHKEKTTTTFPKWLPDVVLAGSSFVYSSNKTNRKPGDIDLWILKGNKTTLCEVIRRICLKAQALHFRPFMLQTGSIITILCPKVRFQIIFSEYHQ